MVRLSSLALAILSLSLVLLPLSKLHGQGAPAAALEGRVTSAEEGAMEGVLVSAKRAGSTITVTVVSGSDGRYSFPKARLEPGAYALHIHATGYDLEGSASAQVSAGKPATADLKLIKTRDLASQISNTEWIASFPGTDQQKTFLRNCSHCHTLERIARSKHTPDQFLAVIERMSGYTPLAFPLMPQRIPVQRIGGAPTIPSEPAVRQRMAEFLASINLSKGPEWKYTLKTLPRLTGKATRVIYTEYDLPAKTRQPHDVVVDSQGFVWYASFGEQILGKLDAKTGKITEYPVPTLKPKAPTGSLAVRFDEDENLWLGMQFQAGIARFDRKTEKFQTWTLPASLDGPHVQINMVGPNRHKVDGKVWFQDSGTFTVLRLDVASGKIESFEPYPLPRPNLYDIIPDSHNNGYFTVMGSGDIGRIDAKTGKITIFTTPTPNSGPRRGMMDSQDRLWFGENRASKIGMFDTRSGRFKEWVPPTPGAWPYDVTLDKNGEAWAGGEFNNRILRLNPETGKFVEYALPGLTNVRRVFVDNSTTPVTFWVGSNHAASIIRLEPLDAQYPQSSSAAKGR